MTGVFCLVFFFLLAGTTVLLESPGLLRKLYCCTRIPVSPDVEAASSFESEFAKNKAKMIC